jgi:energy-coupling factor transporter ATP-binding protein EcfA2
MPKALALPKTDFSFGAKVILKDCSLELEKGSFVLLTGPTGCGKSTLLKMLAGLIPSQVKTFGKVALLFQNPDLQFAMPTLFDELVFALENEQLGKKEAEIRIKEAVQLTNTESFLYKKFADLSGGEKQRASLSVLLAMNADILLLDEPFANCDPVNRQKLLAVLERLHAQGKTIVAADHDWRGYEGCDLVWHWADHQVAVEEPSSFFKKQVPVRYSFALPQGGHAFDFHDFSFGFEKDLVEPSNLFLAKGQATWLTGANGAGKSTLLNILSKLESYQGQVFYQDKELGKWKKPAYFKQVGQVFQQSSQQFLTANVADELAISKNAQLPGFFDEEKTKELLTDLGLTDLTDMSPYLLSGGQQKLLQLACMLILNRDVLLLDEPLAGLDSAFAGKAAAWLKRAQQAGQTQLIVSHQDLPVGQCACHLVLKDRRLAYVEN